jgi:hypothetical protein
MKKLVWIALALTFSTSTYACNPIGWKLVKEASLGVGERACTYEKSGYQVTILVSGFCPFNPC